MTGFKRRVAAFTLGITAMALILAGSLSASAQTTSWDAAVDFSASANPTGAWSYGWSAGRGSAFNLSTVAGMAGGLNAWRYSSSQLEPVVFYNGAPTTVTAFGTSPIPAGSLAFHPGPSGQNAVVRWTAPSAGSYNVVATFTGRDQVGPTSTDVAVLSNGGQLWAGAVSGYLATQDFTAGLLKLNAGDTIDFTVGYGSDGSYYYDMTGLSARISLPSPPVVSVTTPVQGATYTLGQTVIAAYACTSPVLIPLTCVGTVPNGSPIDTASTGSRTFSVVSKDSANNTTSASVTYTVTYAICWLHEPTKVVVSGETTSIRLALCDSRGVDVSSPSITVTAVALTQAATGAPVALTPVGSSNPQNMFRFDPDLGTNGGYIFHLGTDSLAPGTYALSFSVSGDPTSHTALFTVVTDRGQHVGAPARVQRDELKR
jgi:hypothetical protein